ncbi:hypothetical protein LEP1GSC125_2075 [Leptospira mayottensis 200901122]|uniref:Uncharacterized protein n=1 Tax=Leptospira mayottensis 200901122 TaxID=1193010 RepID=A0AA87MMB1_9LEPT|nr:hypothetical protein LEP1GSC125_2075 [Leptospira mayottensis 200901122]
MTLKYLNHFPKIFGFKKGSNRPKSRLAEKFSLKILVVNA